jgi:hypothetical protein
MLSCVRAYERRADRRAANGSMPTDLVGATDMRDALQQLLASTPRWTVCVRRSGRDWDTGTPVNPLVLFTEASPERFPDEAFPLLLRSKRVVIIASYVDAGVLSFEFPERQVKAIQMSDDARSRLVALARALHGSSRGWWTSRKVMGLAFIVPLIAFVVWGVVAGNVFASRDASGDLAFPQWTYDVAYVILALWAVSALISGVIWAIRWRGGALGVWPQGMTASSVLLPCIACAPRSYRPASSRRLRSS